MSGHGARRSRPTAAAGRPSTVCVWLACAGLWGCADDTEGPPQQPAPLASRPETEPRDEPVVVDAAVMAQELDAAIAEARRTSGAARERWQEDHLRARREAGDADDADLAGGTERGLSAWAIKWAAPVVGPIDRGGIEHVWVRPTRWSAQRIEGLLLSAPRRDIGAVAGEVVSFPARELTDWLRDDGRDREGGFTIEVLERWARR